ncbi:hypothetical protein Nepgr_015464 [Nepenthes gracilis]|uniref:Uncharacterized protein n=1 Tax=Nepenthes gracilis TaxID=150966 RepID=A0AAD3SL53_NEPGR|nr:hypothetical protein Nepgr_015464 [Nepenthes gracilis]
MSMASLQQSFLANAIIIPTHRPKPRFPHPITINACKRPSEDGQNGSQRKLGQQLAKVAMVTLAAGVLTLASVDEASAAKSGGRIGGQAFRPSTPRASSPRINNSRTNIYINPPVAPPLVGGYGFGPGVPYYGGWGWSPFSFFAPGPSVAVGIGGGFELFALFLILGAASAVIRRFLGSRGEDDYED